MGVEGVLVEVCRWRYHRRMHASYDCIFCKADMQEWKKIESKIDKYFDQYEGYISSHDHERADDAKLAELAKKIRIE